MLHRLLSIFLLTLGVLGITRHAGADTYFVTLDPAARTEPATGRVILFFITKTANDRREQRWEQQMPIEGPFFDAPQPIASIEVKDFKPGDTVKIDGAAPAFPDPLDKLNGKIRVQAILDADQTERSHEDGPGNVYSDDLRVEVSSTRHDEIKLTLNHKVEIPKRQDQPNLKWIRYRSELLSKFYGRDVYHRAGVALPKHYNDPNWQRQQWPAIYVVPGYGGRDEGAIEYASMLTDTPGVDDIAPIAVYIVLDPESPLGHHGFVDSENNGPRAAALVSEFIPYLEKQFRLVNKPEARLITGHSSGGWSSLWLQINYPNVFGGCWASSPDPVDFTAFQMTDLYRDKNMFVDESGKEIPSYRRRTSSDGEPVPLMMVRQEAAMEHAIDPNGRSGQQWDAWNAAFSPKDVQSNQPRRMFDPISGAIDRSVVDSWSKYDISKLVSSRWNELGPVVLNNVRLMVGNEDDYYLNRAVERFKNTVETLQKSQPISQPSPPAGSIEIVPKANHNTIHAKIFMRWNQEMRTHLQKNGLQDMDSTKSK